jgi:sarcosine oxidase gamma subunit
VADQAYRLMFRPSFGTYFSDWLVDAAAEFG